MSLKAVARLQEVLTSLWAGHKVPHEDAVTIGSAKHYLQALSAAHPVMGLVLTVHQQGPSSDVSYIGDICKDRNDWIVAKASLEAAIQNPPANVIQLHSDGHKRTVEDKEDISDNTQGMAKLPKFLV